MGRMRRLIQYGLFLGLAYAGWKLPEWFDDRRFRLEEVSFDHAGSLAVERGARYRLSLNLRGCTPNRAKMCEGEVSLRVEGPETGVLTGLENIARGWQFAKRTGRTYASLQTQGQVRSDAPAGQYVLIVEASDRVSGRKAREQVFFEVKP